MTLTFSDFLALAGLFWTPIAAIIIGMYIKLPSKDFMKRLARHTNDAGRKRDEILLRNVKDIKLVMLAVSRDMNSPQIRDKLSKFNANLENSDVGFRDVEQEFNEGLDDDKKAS